MVTDKDEEIKELQEQAFEYAAELNQLIGMMLALNPAPTIPTLIILIGRLMTNAMVLMKEVSKQPDEEVRKIFHELIEPCLKDANTKADRIREKLASAQKEFEREVKQERKISKETEKEIRKRVMDKKIENFLRDIPEDRIPKA